MKFTGFVIGFISLVAFAGFIGINAYASYQWDNQYLGYWNLSDKSSTLVQKSEYMDKFVDKVSNGTNKDDYNALFLKNLNNSCGENVKALQSLKTRLDQLKPMDQSSLAYQQAIQQITAQEQGQAGDMLGQIQGCWEKQNYYLSVWNPIIGLIWFFGSIIGIIIGVAMLMSDY